MKKLFQYLKSLFVIILFFCSSYFIMIPIWLFKIDTKTMSAGTSILLTLFSNILLLFILFLIYRKSLIEEWKTFRKNGLQGLDIGFKYWFIGLLIMITSNVIINMFFTHNVATNEQTVQKMIDMAPWVMLLNAGVIAPIIEEITFRKTFKDCFKNKWIFALSSGLFFGFLHVVNFSNVAELFYIIPYGSLGVCFALAYYHTNTVFTSISMHIFHNTVLTLISILPTIL